MNDTEGRPLPVSWKPGPGDKLAGFLIAKREAPSRYRSEPVTVLVVETGAGDVSLWCSPKQLRSFAGRDDLTPGTWIEVLYEGDIPVYGGHVRKEYRASVGPLD